MKEKHHVCGGAASLYESLSAAVADINEGVIRVQRPAEAKVAVTADRSGRMILRLLEDVTESAQLQIQKDAVLMLDGHSLTFTGDGCLTFAAGTDCQIDGQVEGSMIRKEITAEAAGRYLIRTYGDHLLVRGGAYRVEGYYPGGSMVIHATDTCKLLEVLDCQVSAVHEGEQDGAGVKTIQTQAEATVLKNADITAQSGGYAQAVFGQGDIRVQKCEVIANSNSGDSKGVWSAGGTVTLDNATVNATSVNGVAQTVCGSNNTTMMTLNGTILGASSDTNHAIAVEGRCVQLTVTDSDIHSVSAAETTGGAQGINVLTQCTLKAKNTTILADAKEADVSRGPVSIAVINNGISILEDMVLNATHSGVQNSGKLYVSGGLYTGYCHGGFYFCHGPEGEAFVNDATLRGGCYEGIFDYSQQDVKFSALYVGGSSGSAAYLDNCIIDGSDANTSIVLRDTSNEENNTLNVSNCTLVDPAKWIRVDNNTLRINIGMGGNITAASLKYLDKDLQTPIDYVELGRAVFNGELYRRHHDGHICTGQDYMALRAMVEAKLAA